MCMQSFRSLRILVVCCAILSSSRCSVKQKSATDIFRIATTNCNQILLLRGGRVIYGTLPSKAKPESRALNLQVRKLSEHYYAFS